MLPNLSHFFNFSSIIRALDKGTLDKTSTWYLCWEQWGNESTRAVVAKAVQFRPLPGRERIHLYLSTLDPPTWLLDVSCGSVWKSNSIYQLLPSVKYLWFFSIYSVKTPDFLSLIWTLCTTACTKPDGSFSFLSQGNFLHILLNR